MIFVWKRFVFELFYGEWLLSIVLFDVPHIYSLYSILDQFRSLNKTLLRKLEVWKVKKLTLINLFALTYNLSFLTSDEQWESSKLYYPKNGCRLIGAKLKGIFGGVVGLFNILWSRDTSIEERDNKKLSKRKFRQCLESSHPFCFPPKRNPNIIHVLLNGITDFNIFLNRSINYHYFVYFWFILSSSLNSYLFPSIHL